MATAVSNSVSLPPVDATNGTLTDEFINALVQGGSWQFGGGPRTLTYSFNINWDFDLSGHLIPGAGGNWTSSLIDAVNRAFTQWSNVANISFQNIASGTYYFESNADIALALTGNELQSDPEFPAVGLGIVPDPALSAEIRNAFAEFGLTYRDPAGDVFLDNAYSGYQYLNTFGGTAGFGFDAILHEIGHALGLKHPHDDGGNGRPTFADLGIADYDAERWTIMSNNPNPGSTLEIGNDISPMPLDILAIQQIYGANMSYHAGNDDYQLGPYGRVVGRGEIYTTLWDAGGVDTIRTQGLTDFVNGSGNPAPITGVGVMIDMRPGIGFVKGEIALPGQLPFVIHTPLLAQTFSMTHTAIAYNVILENAVGSEFADTIVGNDVDNRIDGGPGVDHLVGGEGNDTYVLDNGADVVTELSAEGDDTIISAASVVTLPSNVEKLTLTGFGAQGVGDAGNNVLTSMAAQQTLRGGAGDDTYVITANPAPTFVSLSGDQGEHITRGQSVYLDATLGGLSIFASDSPSDLDSLVDTLSVGFFPSSGGSWLLDFSTAQTGFQLLPGTFAGALKFSGTGSPAMNITSPFGGSNFITGQFTVHTASYDYSQFTPRVQDLSLSFEMHSEGGIPALRGLLHINRPGSMSTIVEAPSEGFDTVLSAVSYELPANIENLVLTGFAETNGIGNGLNNTLTGNNANNVLNGGAGGDTAEMSGAFRKYSLSGNPMTVANLSGPEGSDSLVSIETLKFLDGSKTYDAASHIWQTQRLYGTAFDRAADPLGLNFHSSRLDGGTALSTVAQDFANSPEFLATYGSLNNTQFVTQLYQNVLNRAPDAGGLAYWSGQLNSGAMTRGAVLAGFSESAENIANYAPQLALGQWDIDESAASVARLYMAALDRSPDVGGLTYWTGQLKSGAQTLTHEAGAFVTSPEFVSTYGALSNSQFITQLYLNVLDRAPDAAGLSYWVGQVNSASLTRAEVLVGFSESLEHIVKTIGVIDNGIVVL